MRIVAGDLRGRKLATPPGEHTRPTTDKAREAIFNALGSLGVLDGAVVADLFAGSGALGFEALSRGAAECTFVERDRRARAAIEQNRESLGLRDRTRVLAGDAVALAARIDADVVFVDPPYGTVDWSALLAALPDGVGMIVAEDGDPIEAPPGWVNTRSRRYGRAWVTFLQRSDHQLPCGDLWRPHSSPAASIRCTSATSTSSSRRSNCSDASSSP